MSIQSQEALSLLEWHIIAGADECIADTPHDCFASYAAQLAAMQSPAPAAQSQGAGTSAGNRGPSTSTNTGPRLASSPNAAIAKATELANSATSIDALKSVIESFDGCSLKKIARNLVFADGSPESDIMIIGSAPNKDSDGSGQPFAGSAGELLEKMFTAIGIARSELYLTDMLFWRPPGGRNPSQEELAICLPFVEKHIQLAKPKHLILTNAFATTALLNRSESLTRLRGKPLEYTHASLEQPIPVHIIYHPADLLRNPNQKRQAWQDLLALKALLSNASEAK